MECTTMCAPSSIGLCRYGLRKVLSTTTVILRGVASLLSAAMSATRMVGFVGVSRYNIFVLGRKASSTASVEEVSTKLNSSPKCTSNWVESRNTPPYTASESTTWSPGRSSRKTASIPAMPDEKTYALWPSSSLAMVRSRALRFGWLVRA